jgi:hypothetical protein
MPIAVRDSVTVSMAALTTGILNVIRSVSRVETSISLGKTEDSAGINKTSSNVRPTGKTSCSNITHLRARLKKTQTRAWVSALLDDFKANIKFYTRKNQPEQVERSVETVDSI